MRPHSLKLFVGAFVLGLATIFTLANAAHAQQVSSFDIPFDFHVFREKLAAGTYEFQKIGDNAYRMKNTATKNSRIIAFNALTGDKGAADAESLVFNRYGENYFLNSLFDARGNAGRRIIETSYEKKMRREMSKNANQSAKKMPKPERVSVKSSR